MNEEQLAAVGAKKRDDVEVVVVEVAGERKEYTFDHHPVDPVAPEYLDTVAPIPAEDLRGYYTNKNLIYRVNYSKSRLRGLVFLTYLSNVAIPTHVVFDTPISKAEYQEIMLAFMLQRAVTNSNTLSLMLAQLLLWAKGVPYDQIPYDTGISEEYIHDFCTSKETTEDGLMQVQRVMQWLHFMDSSLVFGIVSIRALEEQAQVKASFEAINDKEYVGHNVVNLYGVPHFTEQYFGLKGAAYTYNYFPHQFETYMFNNKHLAQYFARNNNFVQHMLVGMANGAIDVQNPLAFLAPKEAPNESSSSTSED